VESRGFINAPSLDKLYYYLKPLRKMECKRLERDITQKCIVVEEELEERPTNHIDKT